MCVRVRDCAQVCDTRDADRSREKPRGCRTSTDSIQAGWITASLCVAVPFDNIDSPLEFATSGTRLAPFARGDGLFSLIKAP